MKYLKRFNESIVTTAYFKEISNGIRSYLDEYFHHQIDFTLIDIMSRVDEFDVIKQPIGSKRNDICIDLISLNSLLDYYQAGFDKDKIKQKIANCTFGSLNVPKTYILLGHSNYISFINESIDRPIKSKVHIINESNVFRNINYYIDLFKSHEINLDLIERISTNFAAFFTAIYNGSSAEEERSTSIYCKIYDDPHFAGIEVTKSNKYTTLLTKGNQLLMIGGEFFDEGVKSKELFKVFSILYGVTNAINNSLCDLFNIHKKELLDRYDEFEIIKKNKIDLISLNNLFDYYNVKFSEGDFLKNYDRIKNANMLYVEKLIKKK